MKTTSIVPILAAGLLCLTATVNVNAYSFDDNLTGDWGGNRSTLHDAGVDIGLSYTAEPAASVSGGYKTGSTYLHNINAELKIDLEKTIGIPNTSFLAKYSSRSGDNLSEDSVAPAASADGRYSYGEYFNKSQEAFGGQTTKLTNFQFTTRFSDNFSADYGRLVMNDLFLRSDLYCNFMNNGICGSPKGVFTPYALNAYPDATAGIHLKVQANKMLDIKVGVFDGGWTKQDPNGWDWSLGENGAAVIGELQLFFDRATNGGAQRVVKFGINHNTGDFTNFRTGEQTAGNTSYYLLSDWRLFHEDHDSNQGLAAFGSVVINDDEEVAGLPVSYSLGLLYEGLIPTRDRDKLGCMVTIAEHSKYNSYTHNGVENLIRGTETVLELSYNLVIAYGIEIMPTLQYIQRPNGSRDLDDVTVLGTKLNVNF
ncbi:MAG: hypothetical protein DSY80_04325 [Desulfocapsa sp.]|nr:MAG: hypothetical protein DSY80_04325 [Desulfocapsa sp.]